MILELFCVMLTCFGNSVLMEGACIFPQWPQVYMFFCRQSTFEDVEADCIVQGVCTGNICQFSIPGTREDATKHSQTEGT